MSDEKAPNLPSTPTYYEDPAYTQSLSKLQGLGNRLTSFDFTGDLAPLAGTINVDPNVTSTYFQGLQPYYEQMRRQTISELAANNQLESSVTANRLGQIDTDIASNLQGRVSDQLTQAMENRIRLFGSGLNAVNQVAGYSQANQGQRNQFNLENYQNQVEFALASQKPKRGGLSGGLAGAAGGAAAGFAMGGPWGALAGGVAGGLYGGLSRTPGAGGQLLTQGAGLAGSKLPSYAPGSTASNQPFSDTNTVYQPLSSRTDDVYGLYGGLRR